MVINGVIKIENEMVAARNIVIATKPEVSSQSVMSPMVDRIVVAQARLWNRESHGLQKDSVNGKVNVPMFSSNSPSSDRKWSNEVYLFDQNTSRSEDFSRKARRRFVRMIPRMHLRLKSM